MIMAMATMIARIVPTTSQSMRWRRSAPVGRSSRIPNRGRSQAATQRRGIRPVDSSDAEGTNRSSPAGAVPLGGRKGILRGIGTESFSTSIGRASVRCRSRSMKCVGSRSSQLGCGPWSLPKARVPRAYLTHDQALCTVERQEPAVGEENRPKGRSYAVSSQM